MADDILIFDDESQSSKYSPKKIDNRTLVQKINDYLISSQSLKVKDKVVFYRLLATMVNAGISVLKSITILEGQEKNPVIKKILGKLKVLIRDGKSLSDSMLYFPSSFSNSEIGIIESGEKTGKLNNALLTLSVQIEKVSSISKKLKSALMYPLMIILVVILVMFVMMVFVVPKLLDIFEDKSSLPGSTKALIAVSDFFVNYWYFLIGFIFIFFFFVGIWKKTPNGHYNYDKIMLKFPIFGDIIRKVIISKFSRVLSGLLGSGISIVEALRITAESVGNEVYRQRIMLLRDDIKQGLKLYEGLEGDPIFPDILVQMIQVGEQTAQLSSIIIKISDFYDEEIDNTVGMINKLLEPFIIVFMAVMVGFIAIGVMQPIMNIAEQVSQ